MISHQSLFIFAAAGFALVGLFFWIDRQTQTTATRLHDQAKWRHQLQEGYARAEVMARRRYRTHEACAMVSRYIDQLERLHRNLDREDTGRFDRLRQTLAQANGGVRVVV